MNTLKEVRTRLRTQWNEMIGRGTFPVLEYEIKGDDYILINIDLNDDNTHFIFSFDDRDLPTYFSGGVEKDGYRYKIEIEEYTEDLDSYLELITEEIGEGFLLPNDLYPEDC